MYQLRDCASAAIAADWLKAARLSKNSCFVSAAFAFTSVVHVQDYAPMAQCCQGDAEAQPEPVINLQSCLHATRQFCKLNGAAASYLQEVSYL